MGPRTPLAAQPRLADQWIQCQVEQEQPVPWAQPAQWAEAIEKRLTKRCTALPGLALPRLRLVWEWEVKKQQGVEGIMKSLDGVRMVGRMMGIH
jgi:hypothetical protein